VPSKLLASTGEGDALFAFFMKVNGYIGCAASFMSFDLDVFFLNGGNIRFVPAAQDPASIAYSSRGLPSLMGTAPAKVPVREALIPAEFDRRTV